MQWRINYYLPAESWKKKSYKTNSSMLLHAQPQNCAPHCARLSRQLAWPTSQRAWDVRVKVWAKQPSFSHHQICVPQIVCDGRYSLNLVLIKIAAPPVQNCGFQRLGYFQVLCVTCKEACSQGQNFSFPSWWSLHMLQLYIALCDPWGQVISNNWS